MKKIFCLLIVFGQLFCHAQIAKYKKTTVMIPMRDGIKLFTVIYSPVTPNGTYPFMIERTPYGAYDDPKDTISLDFPGYGEMASEGYIFVFQDIRGKYKSEG